MRIKDGIFNSVIPGSKCRIVSPGQKLRSGHAFEIDEIVSVLHEEGSNSQGVYFRCENNYGGQWNVYEYELIVVD